MLTIGADIEGIARTIWATLFDLPLEPRARGPRLGPESSVTSFVHIDGAWHGALVLRCPMALARTLTAAMFQAESTTRPRRRPRRTRRARQHGGGNVKALLPAPSQISLPAVALGSDYEISVVGTSSVATRVVHLRRPPAASSPFCSGQARRERDVSDSHEPERRGGDRVATPTDPGRRRLDGDPPDPRRAAGGRRLPRRRGGRRAGRARRLPGTRSRPRAARHRHAGHGRADDAEGDEGRRGPARHPGPVSHRPDRRERRRRRPRAGRPGLSAQAVRAGRADGAGGRWRCAQGPRRRTLPQGSRSRPTAQHHRRPDRPRQPAPVRRADRRRCSPRWAATPRSG